MRRFLLTAALAATAFAAPASATHDCNGLDVGVPLGDLHVGVCVRDCTDECELATVYCEGVAPAARYCQVVA